MKKLGKFLIKYPIAWIYLILWGIIVYFVQADRMYMLKVTNIKSCMLYLLFWVILPICEFIFILLLDKKQNEKMKPDLALGADTNIGTGSRKKKRPKLPEFILYTNILLVFLLSWFWISSFLASATTDLKDYYNFERGVENRVATCHVLPEKIPENVTNIKYSYEYWPQLDPCYIIEISWQCTDEEQFREQVEQYLASSSEFQKTSEENGEITYAATIEVTNFELKVNPTNKAIKFIVTSLNDRGEKFSK